MKISIKNERKRFDVKIDGISRPVWVWVKGLDVGRFYFESDKDKNWYENEIGWDKRNELKAALKKIRQVEPITPR